MIAIYFIGVILAFDTFTSSEPAGIRPLCVIRNIKTETYINGF